MTEQTQKRRGVLGRGPIFWVVLLAISTALIGLLAATEAIESKSVVMLLLIVPAGLMVAVVRSAQIAAVSGAASCAGSGVAQARYIKRVAIFTSLYLATFALMTFVEQSAEPPYAIKFVIALLPGLAIIGVFWAIGRLMVEEPDEFMRMLIVRQSLVATAVALSAASIWGFLEAANMVPHLDAYWVAIAWFFGLFVGAVINRIEHGTWGAV